MKTIAVALACAFFLACNGDSEPGSRYAVEAEVLLETSFNELLDTAADELRGGSRSASVSAAQIGRLGQIPTSATPGFNPYAAQAGGRTSFSGDANGDGVAESIDVFKAAGGAIFLGWQSGGACHAIVESLGTKWYFRGNCGEDGAVVCRYVPALSCQLCDADACSDCEPIGATGNRFGCFPIDAPSPEPPEDTGVGDTGAADTGTSVDDTGTTDTGGTDAPIFDVVADTGPVIGDCSSECMSASFAECCRECGCQGGSGMCMPVCRDGSTWDCEQGCCFNFSTFECEH